MPGPSLGDVTPLVLTLDEEPNIGRTLESLRWAHRVVVLDSGSTDGTERIARAFSNVSWHRRPFDSHAAQWAHGVHGTGIKSPFVLALDADMTVPGPFVRELERSFLGGDYAGGVVAFQYRVLGRALGGSVYPAQVRIFRRDGVAIEQPGHTQEFAVDGSIYSFRTRIVHDDRKPLERWAASQAAYSALEARRLADGGRLRLRDRLRRWGIMPPIAMALAYFRAGGPFRGAAAVRYASERAAYECLLAIRLMTARLDRAAERREWP